MELIKCIDPNEGEALKRGRGGGGQTGGREGRVGCIDVLIQMKVRH